VFAGEVAEASWPGAGATEFVAGAGLARATTTPVRMTTVRMQKESSVFMLRVILRAET
jgi:hypothetical protein